MDNIIGDALQHYYKVLQFLGFKKQADVNKILFFIALQDLFIKENATFRHLMDERLERSIKTVLNRHFDCTCEFPKPKERTYVGKLQKADPPTFIVNFLDWDGTELKTQEVKYGNSAVPPSGMKREGWMFKAWSNDLYKNVKKDADVTAIYEMIKYSIFVYNPLTGLPIYSKLDCVMHTNVEDIVLETIKSNVPKGYDLLEPSYVKLSGSEPSDILEDTALSMNLQKSIYKITIYTSAKKSDVAFTLEAEYQDDMELAVAAKYNQWLQKSGLKSHTYYGVKVEGLKSVEHDIEGYIQSEVKTFNVSFYVGALCVKKQTVEYGAAANPPEDPYKEKYIFAGWEGNYLDVTKDEKVVAKFERNQVTATFKLIRISGTEETLEPMLVDCGSNVPEPTLPEATQYTHWDKWDKSFFNIQTDTLFTIKEGYNKGSFALYMAEDEKNINFKLITTKKLEEGFNFADAYPTLYMKEFEKYIPAGFKPKGWSTTKKNLTEPLPDDLTSVGDKSLYYFIDRPGVKVTFFFVYDDGTRKQMFEDTVVYGSNIVTKVADKVALLEKNNKLEDDQYYGDIAGNTGLEEVTSNKAIEIKVCQKAKGEIIFKTDGGTVIKKVVAVKDEKVPVPNTPDIKGKSFKHWDPAISGSVTATGKAAVYTAIYEENKYNCVFKWDNPDGSVVGSDYKAYSVTYGASVSIPTPGEFAGYKFTKWEYKTSSGKAVNTKAVTESFLATAVYSKNESYTVTWKATHGVTDEICTVDTKSVELGGSVEWTTKDIYAGNTLYSGFKLESGSCDYDEEKKTIKNVKTNVVLMNTRLPRPPQKATYTVTWKYKNSDNTTLLDEYVETLTEGTVIKEPAASKCPKNYKLGDWIFKEGNRIGSAISKNSVFYCKCPIDREFWKYVEIEGCTALSATYPKSHAKPSHLYLKWEDKKNGTIYGEIKPGGSVKDKEIINGTVWEDGKNHKSVALPTNDAVPIHFVFDTGSNKKSGVPCAVKYAVKLKLKLSNTWGTWDKETEVTLQLPTFKYDNNQIDVIGYSAEQSMYKNPGTGAYVGGEYVDVWDNRSKREYIFKQKVGECYVKIKCEFTQF